MSERTGPLCGDAVRKIVGRPGREASIEFPVRPHMLRHATGYKLAYDGTRGRSSIIWDTTTFSIPPATPN